MKLERATKRDFDSILDELGEFWRTDTVRSLHHPMFVYEFGDTAYVVRDECQVVAYLFGFFAQTAPVGYVHLVAVRRSHRRLGLARRLYEHFVEQARAHGCSEIKAITTLPNADAIEFHRRLGMEINGDAAEAGVAVVRDYSGPGLDRVVFRKSI